MLRFIKELKMLDDTPEYEFFSNKRTDRIYLSRSMEQKVWVNEKDAGVEPMTRPFRILSKVFDGKESHEFITQGKQLALRITEGQRQEIVIKFYEDTRGIFTLQLQKFSTETGNPHKTYFTFVNEEIGKLYNFIRNVALLPIAGGQAQKFDDKYLEEIVLTREQTLKLISANPGLISEILKNNISQSDIVALGYRKEQLVVFERLLSDKLFFEDYKLTKAISKDESAWQYFFEKNTWIFGYGLNYILNTPLAGRKLEQVVAGYNAFTAGKRADALMQTKGLISSLCFGEIKTHLTPLLNKEYRSEAYSISEHLAGGIAQVQKTIQKSIKDLTTKLGLKDKEGNPTGEDVFLYQPKGFLIIGSLVEFKTENGINEDKYGSFELFRRSIQNPEIMTFDELFERAKYIVEFSGQ